MSGEYSTVLNFVKTIVSGFELSHNRKRVGIIVFNNYASVEVPIGDYVDAADLNRKIDALPRPTNGETFYGALVKIRSMFQADHRFEGKPYKRFVAIFITDGWDGAYTQVQSEATAAHADDIVIISIGIGSYVNTAQIQGMASKSNFALFTSTANDLDSLSDDVVKYTCEAECLADVVLAIDRSGSMSGEYSTVLNFVKTIVSGFELSHNRKRVGIIVFNNYASVEVPIGDYVDAADLNRKIDALPRPTNGETFYGALVKIRGMFQADHRFEGKPNWILRQHGTTPGNRFEVEVRSFHVDRKRHGFAVRRCREIYM
ncbi:hypothetical protein NP493_1501g00023 [Ridgeia piscesae]|uniref:VWFA domain-containing protein n=1 Tax=Ridgeia piscesae TaxID=27915 RepID=A0AAD9K1I2_RIDPI|nr:hypothetical protein NP493_1501g00023 [Ridgeia piscesae]